jgi:anhydro-N-acetylmuramic acid kinase
MAWFIGLMSGTSLDGVDGVLAHSRGERLHAVAHVHRPFPDALRAELLALNTPGDNELHRAAQAAQALARLYAEVAQALPAAPEPVRAIGAHGQTVRHRVDSGYTLQLLNGALLAELTGIDVVCDFRSRDVAAGGKGAPLVPAFHAAMLARPGVHVAVLNMGGIGNLTLLGAGGRVQGFDCGPGNLLLDLWCQQHTGQPFDTDGRWAAGAPVDTALLQRLLAEPFLALRPPKSTGRDLFHAGWLAAQGVAGLPPQAVQATLAEFTARCAIDALRHHAPGTTELLVCGGGAFNGHLMARLAALAGPAVQVLSTQDKGLAPDQVEALAFAWLAQAHMQRKAGNLPAVTGAAGPRVLGAMYPAR